MVFQQLKMMTNDDCFWSAADQLVKREAAYVYSQMADWTQIGLGQRYGSVAAKKTRQYFSLRAYGGNRCVTRNSTCTDCSLCGRLLELKLLDGLSFRDEYWLILTLKRRTHRDQGGIPCLMNEKVSIRFRWARNCCSTSLSDLIPFSKLIN